MVSDREGPSATLPAMAKMANLAKIHQGPSENLNKTTIATPGKVAKLMRMTNLTKVPRYAVCMSRS